MDEVVEFSWASKLKWAFRTLSSLGQYVDIIEITLLLPILIGKLDPM